MKNILLLNKKEGETPLEALESFRSKNKKYQDLKMTYAGRLDPMASGALLLLAGEETKNKEKYLKFSKEYEFSVLFGFATDTYDILGKVIPSDFPREITREDLRELIEKNLKYFRGQFIQKYPLYSSKTIKKARAGKSGDAPEHEVRVMKLKFLKLSAVTADNFLKNIERRVAKVKGDFRQKEILRIWRKNLKNSSNSKEKFFLGSFHIKCGSGTYVRGIAHSLGERLSIPALAFSINRTKIGNFRLVE